MNVRGRALIGAAAAGAILGGALTAPGVAAADEIRPTGPNGVSYIRTESGRTLCGIEGDRVNCTVQFVNPPLASTGDIANSVSLNQNGTFTYLAADLGVIDPPHPDPLRPDLYHQRLGGRGVQRRNPLHEQPDQRGLLGERHRGQLAWADVSTRESLRDSDSAAEAAESEAESAPARSRRLGLRGVVAVAVALSLVIAASMGMYLLHRNSNYTEEFGSLDTPDRVSVQVWINRVDTTSETLRSRDRLRDTAPPAR